MKESKINNKTPEEIISAAIYSLCSCGPCSGLEGLTRTHQPSTRFSEQVTFPMQTSRACEAELLLDTSGLLCLHRVFACHTPPSSSWDMQAPKLHSAKTMMTASSLYAENVLELCHADRTRDQYIF